MDIHSCKIKEVIKSVLGDSYEKIKISEVSVYDPVEVDGVKVNFKINKKFISGDGQGMVDAIFSSLKKDYLDLFPSLKNIEIKEFKVEAQGVDLLCKVKTTLILKNSYGKTIEFSNSFKSLISSICEICAEAAEYLINSEKSYKILQVALQDAKLRGRQDLVEKYTAQISTVVETTSYED